MLCTVFENNESITGWKAGSLLAYCAGMDPGEVKWVNFHPPFSEPSSFFFFPYPSNVEIIFDFSDIITKIHPPFQNPGSVFAVNHVFGRNDKRNES